MGPYLGEMRPYRADRREKPALKSMLQWSLEARQIPGLLYPQVLRSTVQNPRRCAACSGKRQWCWMGHSTTRRTSKQQSCVV